MGEWWREFRGRGVKDALKAASRYAANEAAIDALLAGGGSILHQATMELDHDQIRQLPSIAVQFVGAPGAGRLLVPIVIVARMDWVADYTNINATGHLKADIAGTFVAPLRQSTISGVSALLAGGGPDGTIVAFTLNQLAESKVTSATPNVDPHHHQGAVGSGFYDADLVNLPLQISAENVGSGDYTDGNAGNALRFSGAFYVLDNTTGLYLTTVESGWNQTTRTFA